MILIVGASASGKTEISKELKRLFGIKKAITHTTRAPRKGERDGVDYYFVTTEQFLLLDKNGALVENTVYNGNHYGCSKNEVNDDKCVIVDPNGLKSFLALKDPSVVSFYMYASESNRRSRMLGRGDDPESVEKRIINDRVAFSPDKLSGIDFNIDTDGRKIEDIAKEIYASYLDKLKERGISDPNLLLK